VGTAAFPIDAHNQYQIEVQTSGSIAGAFIVKSDAYIKDNIVEIIIDDFGTAPPPPPPPPPPPVYGEGAISIANNSGSTVTVTGVTIQAAGSSVLYNVSPASFAPSGPLSTGANATTTITGDNAYDIVDGNYTITVAAAADGKTFTVTRTAPLKDVTATVPIALGDIPSTPLAITLVSVSYDNTAGALTPIAVERTAHIVVRVSGFASSADTAKVELNAGAVNGLVISGLDGGAAVGAINTFTLSATLQDTQAFPSCSASITFGITGVGLPAHYTTGNTTAATLSIIDGQAPTVQRAIPVTQTNYAAFNAYAITGAGLTRHYRQTADIALPGAANNWIAIKGADPLTDSADRFSGTYDGGGHTIDGITIHQNADYQGMFGYITGGAVVKNLKLANVNITGAGNCGSVAGYNNGGNVQNCSSAGTINCSTWDNGGVVGYNNGGTVQNCSFTGAITGSESTGGVVGNNNGGTVQYCYATGSVTSEIGHTTDESPGSNAGGVLGYNHDGGTVINCNFNTGTVTALTNAGGVVGKNEDNSVISCHAAGVAVTGARSGGVVGWNTNDGTVTNCSAVDTTPGTVVGVNDSGGTVTP